MEKIRGIIYNSTIKDERALSMNKIREQFDTRLKIQIIGVLVPILVIIVGAVLFFGSSKEHLKAEAPHLDESENITLHMVPRIENEVVEIKAEVGRHKERLGQINGKISVIQNDIGYIKEATKRILQKLE